jgi:hypothetical protein
VRAAIFAQTDVTKPFSCADFEISPKFYEYSVARCIRLDATACDMARVMFGHVRLIFDVPKQKIVTDSCVSQDVAATVLQSQPKD